MLRFERKQQSSVKQLSFNKKINYNKKNGTYVLVYLPFMNAASQKELSPNQSRISFKINIAIFPMYKNMY